MCGICGKLVFQDCVPSRDLIRAMCNMLRHRGPDDEGIYIAPHIGLGQRRLSIIDLSLGACPPLTNEDHTIWLIFNGEIYNFRELRDRLLDQGHRFRTSADTEVLIHLYEEYGFDCLKKLRGMFAFALWDANLKILFCARDRLGKKPFLYARTPHSLVFGSEIKSITVDPEISISPDFVAIDRYLTYQFVPSPETAFDGIRRLRPGEYLTSDLAGTVRTQSYWEPPVAKPSVLPPEELEAEILRRLRESVRVRMTADVPLGAFLSGGIDSGTVVALMSMESIQPVKTFSIGFEEAAYSELPSARLVAQRFGTDHHEMIVKPDAAEILPILVRHFNEPFADSSALPTFYVSRITRQYVTVALSGDGGDESFAGYDNYRVILNWNRCARWPVPFRKLLAGGGRKAIGLLPRNNMAARVCKGLAMVAAANVKDRRLQYGTILKPEEKQWVYAERFRALISRPPIPEDPLAAYPWIDGMDALDWLMRHDQRFYLPDCLMVKTDITSMANGLEVRCPFLDHEFVEFAATIPSSLKRDSSGGKTILKRALSEIMPAEILDRPKMGFRLPVAGWFRTELAPVLKETLLSETVERRGLFVPLALKRMIEEHVSGTRDWSNRLWAFLFLELWFREFID